MCELFDYGSGVGGDGPGSVCEVVGHIGVVAVDTDEPCVRQGAGDLLAGPADHAGSVEACTDFDDGECFAAFAGLGEPVVEAVESGPEVVVDVPGSGVDVEEQSSASVRA